MKLARRFKVLLVLFALPSSTLPLKPVAARPSSSAPAMEKLSAAENYGNLPLSFEATWAFNFGEPGIPRAGDWDAKPSRP